MSKVTLQEHRTSETMEHEQTWGTLQEFSDRLNFISTSSRKSLGSVLKHNTSKLKVLQ